MAYVTRRKQQILLELTWAYEVPLQCMQFSTRLCPISLLLMYKMATAKRLTLRLSSHSARLYMSVFQGLFAA